MLKLLLDDSYHAQSFWTLKNIYLSVLLLFKFLWFWFYLPLQRLHSAKNHKMLIKSAQCIHFNAPLEMRQDFSALEKLLIKTGNTVEDPTLKETVA